MHQRNSARASLEFLSLNFRFLRKLYIFMALLLKRIYLKLSHNLHVHLQFVVYDENSCECALNKTQRFSDDSSQRIWLAVALIMNSTESCVIGYNSQRCKTAWKEIWCNTRIYLFNAAMETFHFIFTLTLFFNSSNRFSLFVHEHSVQLWWHFCLKHHCSARKHYVSSLKLPSSWMENVFWKCDSAPEGFFSVFVR